MQKIKSFLMMNEPNILMLSGMLFMTIGAFMVNVIFGLFMLGACLWITAIISFLNMLGRG